MRSWKRRLWLGIANPLTTAVLLAALWADLRHLAFQEQGTSTCGEIYRRWVSPRQFIPMQPPGPDSWIAREKGALRNGGSEGGKAARSKYAEPFPPGATYEGGLRFLILGGRSGLWAVAHNDTEYRIDIVSRGQLGTDEAAQVRRDYVDRFLAPGWIYDPALLPRLRTADVTISTPRWPGLAHDALAGTGLLLALTSLSWIPASSRWARSRRRQRRGLCPGCGYSLVNLAALICPECGRPIARP